MNSAKHHENPGRKHRGTATHWSPRPGARRFARKFDAWKTCVYDILRISYNENVYNGCIMNIMFFLMDWKLVPLPVFTVYFDETNILHYKWAYNTF
jgi:hypothetical protein